MEEPSPKFAHRFILHLITQSVGWVLLVYLREPLSSLPYLVVISTQIHIHFLLFLVPFWALGIWSAQLHRRSGTVPVIILTFTISTLLSLVIFFAFRDTSNLSRTIFIAEFFASPLIAILTSRILPFPVNHSYTLSLRELELKLENNQSQYSEFHVDIQGWQKTEFYKVIEKSHKLEVPVFLKIPELQPPVFPKYKNAFKSFIDVTGATLGLLALSPLMFFVAMIIYLTDQGPVFFVQHRVGFNGQMFPLYKFRSMVIDAESKKDSLMSKNELKGPAFKMKKDPRITRIGAIIRKTSIDELPQLFNVLRGHMSLVGPRPHLAEEVQHYNPDQFRRLLVTPGLTCIWQVYGRNRVDFDTWISQDLQYIDEWSVALDLRLILLTVPAMVRGEGL
jgi:lipopolysaccharide/colanic/teichoic acid biosynthesis glycosyltransferase